MSRLFIAGLTLALTLALPSRARAEDEVFTAPFEMEGIIYVKGSINGHEDLNLFLDTGASQTVVAEDAAEELGIKGGMQMPVGGVGQQSAKLGRAQSISFAGYTFENQNVALMDISHIKTSSGVKIHSIIGAPILFKFKSVSFDFGTKTATFVVDEKTKQRDFSLLDMLSGGGDGQNPLERLFGGGGDGQNPLERLFGGGQDPNADPNADPSTDPNAPQNPLQRLFGGRRGPGQGRGGRNPFQGAEFEDMSEQLAAHLKVESGLFVKSVEEGSRAASFGLLEGDVLLAVGDTAITTPDDLRTALRGRGRGAAPLTLTVIRKGEKLTFASE